MEQTTTEQTITEQIDRPLRRRAMTTAILCQVFGVLGIQSIEQNGLLVLYYRRLGLSASATLSLISLFALIHSGGRVPLSHLADRLGRKRVGMAGTSIVVVSLLLIAAAGSFSGASLRFLAFSGLVLFAIGEAIFGAGWFSVLHPIIPGRRRGMFFGALRVSWQLFGIGFAAAAALLIGLFPDLWTYQVVFFSVAVAAFARVLLFRRLPDLAPMDDSGLSFGRSFRNVLALPAVKGFLVYVFGRYVFFGAVLQLLALLEREVLGVPDSIVVSLANFGLIGNVAGFLFGAVLVDGSGRHPFFFGTHVATVALLVGFGLRAVIPGYPVIPLYALFHLLLGTSEAIFSVSMTAEQFSLVREEGKALALSILSLAYVGGRAVSRFGVSLLLGSQGLPPTMTFGGYTISNYDLLLFLLAGGLLVTIPLLRLVRRPGEALPPAS
ncbi:MAG: MFS transporter [Spirochaetaceae bacterium]